MLNNYDSLDDLEQAIADYERKYSERKLSQWIIGVITAVVVILVVVVIVAEFFWGLRMSKRVWELEQTLTAVVIPPPVLPTPTASLTATTTSTFTPTATFTFTPSPTYTTTNTAAISDTPTSTATNTSTPTVTTTSAPAPSSTVTPTPVDLSDLVLVSIWKELCPYINDTNKLDSYFDLPPIKIEVTSPGWMLEPDGQKMYLKHAESNESYLLDLTIISQGKPVVFMGDWGQGLQSARELSYEQCGPGDMDTVNYFWIPKADEKAAPQGGRYTFQVMNNGKPVSNATKPITIFTRSYFDIQVDKLYFHPFEQSNIACDGNCGDKTTTACVLKTVSDFYGIQWNESRRLYWAKSSDVEDPPPPYCNISGVYTGVTLQP